MDSSNNNVISLINYDEADLNKLIKEVYLS